MWSTAGSKRVGLQERMSNEEHKVFKIIDMQERGRK